MQTGIAPAKTSPSKPRTPYGRRRKGLRLGTWALLMSVAANVITAIAFVPIAPAFQAIMVKLSDPNHHFVVDWTPLFSRTVSPVTTVASWMGIISFFMGLAALIGGRGRWMGLFAVLVCLFGPTVVMLFLLVIPT